MNFTCYTDFNQLPEGADVLFDLGEKDSLFYSRAWFENVAGSLDDDQVLMLVCVVAENRVLAILPLVKSMVNSGYSLKHQYTTHYSFLIADEDQQKILACLVEGLIKLPLHSLLLEPVAVTDKRIAALQAALETAGYRCERFFRLYNWIYCLGRQPFKDYMAGRPSSLRNTITRKSRKLEREHGYKIQLFAGDEVPAAMSDYYTVYNASWKANEQYVRFLDGIVADFSRAGWSRLAVLYVEGRPVAAQLWFVAHGKASIFRLAYDEAWKHYSPGSLLTCFLMEYVIDVDKVEELDFLTGNEAYKQDWMAERRECFALSCVKDIKKAGWYERFIELLKRLLPGH